jgi:hypothetical protein
VEAVAHWLVLVVVVLCFVMLFVRLVLKNGGAPARFFVFRRLEAFCRLCPFGLAVSNQFEYRV